MTSTGSEDHPNMKMSKDVNFDAGKPDRTHQRAIHAGYFEKHPQQAPQAYRDLLSHRPDSPFDLSYDHPALERAIVAYNRVWDESGSIDAHNVVQVRERAMKAAFTVALSSDAAVRKACETLIDYAEWQVREGHYHPTLVSAINQAKEAVNGQSAIPQNQEGSEVAREFDPSETVLSQLIMGAARIHTHDYTLAFAITKSAIDWITATRNAGEELFEPVTKVVDKSGEIHPTHNINTDAIMGPSCSCCGCSIFDIFHKISEVAKAECKVSQHQKKCWPKETVND